ncbi:MAG: ATP-binding protein [Verrucomicrobiota bacterium]
MAEREGPFTGSAEGRELRGVPGQGRFSQLVDECRRLGDDPRCRRRIQALMRQGSAGPGELHRWIARLPFSAVLTTNQDDLLERAYGQPQGAGTHPLVFTRRTAAQLPGFAGEQRFFILKVHGDAGDVESLVSDKWGCLEVTWVNAISRAAIAQLLCTRTALLIGYGQRDWDLELFLREHALLFQACGRKHYVLVAEEADVASRSFWEGYNIVPLAYAPGCGHEGLEIELGELCRQIKPGTLTAEASVTGGIRHLIEVEREFCQKLGTYIEAERARYIQLHAGAGLDATDRELVDRSIEYWDSREATRTGLEAQLLQAQKMESIGSLAAGIAHDFNNILTAILGYIDLLAADGRLDKDQEEHVLQVKGAAMRAAQLVRQLLAFARRSVAQFSPTDVNEVVQNLANMLRRLVGEDIAMEIALARDLPVVTADRGMLEQAILNLTVNARDAMPKGGTLRLATAACEITSNDVTMMPEAQAGRWVCLTVADNGCGMSPETRSRIFEPFFTTKDVGKGTGLGLSTVYGIVQQHNGWIQVRSELEKGSVFQVFLPEGGPAEPLRQEARHDPRLRGHETILIVEDEPSLRHLVSSILRNVGYRILEAADGWEALRIWGDHGDEIDVLLTDMVMPGGMSGSEVSAALLQRKPGLRVIYTSGFSVDFEAKEELGRTFLAKPYTPQTLRETVRRIVEAT